MSFDKKKISEHDISDCFAEFFDFKVKGIVESVSINPGVHNGVRKIFANDWMFMSRVRIIECVKGLKMKNTEGYDRIPQRIIDVLVYVELIRDSLREVVFKFK